MEANNNITKLIDIDGKSIDVIDATDRLSTANQKMLDHFKQVNYKHIYKLLHFVSPVTAINKFT